MFTTLTRIIKYGLLGFSRNGWLSASTTSILLIALLVFGGLVLFRVITTSTLQFLKDAVDVTIFFKTDAPEDQVLNAKKVIETMPEVKQAEYLSRDQVLINFKELHKNDEDKSALQSLDEFADNPFGAELNIKAFDPKQYAAIADRLNNSPFKDLFRNVTYAKNQEAINNLSNITDAIDRGGLAVIVFLTIISVLVTFNTIRLAIYSSREEIGIMRLVGASNALIRGPYLIEGIIYGLIASALSVLLIAPAVYLISPGLLRFIPSMNLWDYFLSRGFVLFLYQVLFGILLGVISSYIAVRKYLRV